MSLLAPAGSKGLNTGVVRFETLPPELAEDGRDVRVLDEKGRPVSFEWVNEKRERTAEPFAHGRGPLLHFEITNPEICRYVVYFGNPKAESAAQTWKKRIGGLILETRANTRRRNANNFEQTKKLIAASKWKFGEGPRRQINDPENPFGPNEQYISIYRGDIYCPVAGSYGFATDSDDASFLLINEKLVVQWPGGHTPSGRFDHYGEVHLEAGVHRIEYYHVQTLGGALAKAGWRPPGARKVVTIPEQAFVREVRTQTVALETQGKALNAYFRCKQADSLQFGSSGPAFATFEFLDRSQSALSQVAAWEWDFGDGTVSREANPQHVFLGDREHTVTLRCVDVLGFESTWAKNITLPPESERRVDVIMEVAAEETFLRPREPMRLSVKCGNASDGPIILALVTEIRDADGRVVYRHRKPVSIAAGGWETRERRSDEGFGALEAGEVVLRLEYMDVPVVTRALAIRSASDPALELHIERDHLADEHGTPTLLRLSGCRTRHADFPLRRRLERGEKVHLLAVDDSLAGSWEKSYLDLVVERLRERFPAGDVRITRIGHSEGGTRRSHDPLRSFVEFPRRIEEFKPDVVIVAGSLKEIMRFTSVGRFGRALHALVDRISAVHKGEIVLIAPPPVVANPGLARAYAIAVKRLGLHAGVRVADAYSALMRAGGVAAPFAGETDEWEQGGWLEFYRDPDSEAPIYHISPTARGQELIAAVLEEALLAGPLRSGGRK